MDTNYCLICNRKIIKKHINFAQNNICSVCYSKLPFIYKEFKISNFKCLAIYEYNDFIKEIIFRIKALGDKKLALALMSPVKEFLEIKYKNFTIIPMPSSSKSNLKRGFNHVKEMFDVLGLKTVNAFSKKDDFKQSNQSKFRRKAIEKHMIFNPKLINKNSRYLVADDITTTHQTIIFAINKLKEIGVENIEILVVCLKGEKNEKR